MQSKIVLLTWVLLFVWSTASLIIVWTASQFLHRKSQEVTYIWDEIVGIIIIIIILSAGSNQLLTMAVPVQASIWALKHSLRQSTIEEERHHNWTEKCLCQVARKVSYKQWQLHTALQAAARHPWEAPSFFLLCLEKNVWRIHGACDGRGHNHRDGLVWPLIQEFHTHPVAPLADSHHSQQL